MTPEEFKQLDEYKAKDVKFAHDFIFTELGIDVPDYYGKLLRSNELESLRWLQWQKSVQAASRVAGRVPPKVMDYFQKTKHLIRPPKPGDIDIMQTKPLDPALYARRFTWSPSKLMTFETCPMKFAAESFYKTVPYSETVQSIWGTRVHKAAEDYMTSKTVTDPEAFKVVADYCYLLDRYPGERLIEHKIALDYEWKPAEWDSGTESLRCILDLGFKHGDTLKCFDWKTGKVKDDHIQMHIYCYALAILYPDVQHFDFRYVWLKDRTTTGFKISKKEIVPIALDIRQRVARMKEACDTESFPMKRNGLCRQYCGAVDCPHNGGGR